MIQLDERSSKPLYEQIIEQFKLLVARGSLMPEDANPLGEKAGIPAWHYTVYGSKGLSGTGKTGRDRNNPGKGYLYSPEGGASGR